VIQALQVGLGILLGVFLMSWVADRHGRRPAILLATLLGGICVWPFVYVTNFWGILIGIFLSLLLWLLPISAPGPGSHCSDRFICWGQTISAGYIVDPDPRRIAAGDID
jgi:MFS family permease